MLAPDVALNLFFLCRSPLWIWPGSCWWCLCHVSPSPIRQTYGSTMNTAQMHVAFMIIVDIVFWHGLIIQSTWSACKALQCLRLYFSANAWRFEALQNLCLHPCDLKGTHEKQSGCVGPFQVCLNTTLIPIKTSVDIYSCVLTDCCIQALLPEDLLPLCLGGRVWQQCCQERLSLLQIQQSDLAAVQQLPVHCWWACSPLQTWDFLMIPIAVTFTRKSPKRSAAHVSFI